MLDRFLDLDALYQKLKVYNKEDMLRAIALKGYTVDAIVFAINKQESGPDYEVVKNIIQKKLLLKEKE